MTDPQTEGLDQWFAEARTRPPGKARRGLILTVVAVFLAVLAVIAIFVDGAARGAAEDAVEQKLESRLPAGSGPTSASIGGFSFLAQLFSGSLEQLDVSFAVDGAALPALVGVDATVAALSIDGDSLAYDSSIDLLGMSLGYTVTLEPSVDNGMLVLTPTGIESSTENNSVDLGQLVDLQSLALSVCAASLLPVGVELTEVHIVDSKLQFDVTGRNLPIDIAQLRTRGSCD